MITSTSFTKDWINTLRTARSTNNMNPPLLEKIIYALSLAELLQFHQLDFILKGGASLILLLEEPQRFSIDIDIITLVSRQELESVLSKVCQNAHFTHFELDTHRSYQQNIPKAHYKFFFKPILNQDNKILLDVLFDENPYPVLQPVEVRKNWIHTHEPFVDLKVPTIESITGDKLTAFAPNTVGIRYGQNKQTEIIKQMFDLGQLFDKIKDFKTVTVSFNTNVEKELSYRTELAGKTSEDVLNDIWTTCIDVIVEKQEELKKGILAFKNWVINPFRRDEAFETAGKIAYIIAKIKQNDNTSLVVFDPNTMNKRDFLITDPNFNFLNKVKNASNALFYWFQAIKIWIQ
jgi:predicted nucleotidyltransferase component of viral defense system